MEPGEREKIESPWGNANLRRAPNSSSMWLCGEKSIRSVWCVLLRSNGLKKEVIPKQEEEKNTKYAHGHSDKQVLHFDRARFALLRKGPITRNLLVQLGHTFWSIEVGG